jgi:hypothetical protein
MKMNKAMTDYPRKFHVGMFAEQLRDGREMSAAPEEALRAAHALEAIEVNRDLGSKPLEDWTATDHAISEAACRVHHVRLALMGRLSGEMEL